MLTFIKKLLGRPVHSVDTIIADFTSTLTKLETSAAHHLEVAAIKQDAVTAAEKARDEAKREAGRALSVYSKIKGLIA